MAAGGCETTVGQLTPIADPERRIEFAGFSILPPRGPQWLSGPASAASPAEDPGVYRAIFFRLLADVPQARRDGSRTVAALVMVKDLAPRRFQSPAEFVESVRRVGVTQRHRILASQASLMPRVDATCAAYRFEAEDRGVARFPGVTFILAVQGVRCLHPQWPGHAIDISYSQRYPLGEPALILEGEVEPFLASLRFTAERP